MEYILYPLATSAFTLYCDRGLCQCSAYYSKGHILYVHRAIGYNRVYP